MIETRGTVHDVVGEFPLLIEVEEGITYFYFSTNDGLYLVASIETSDLLLSLINAEQPDEDTKN